ncbi:MAG: NnrS family protein [Acidobacteria bacterium]|nr:NnrS family protein [Acidobacteriota bacterium]
MQIFAMGFRAFFLLGAFWAVLSGIWWLGFLHGVITPHQLNPFSWHAHEMIHGFAAAIISGFLLTASANWTKTRGAHGITLFLLVLLWVLNRLAYGWLWFHGPHSGLWTTFVFYVALTCVLLPPLWRARQWHNLGLLLWLLLLGVAEFMQSASLLNAKPVLAERAMLLSLNATLAFVAIIGGRVIPFFTRNKLPHLDIRKEPVAEWFSLGLLLAITVCDLLYGRRHTCSGVLSLFAGLAFLARGRHWHSFETRHEPMLWVLHLGYFFLVCGFLLRTLCHGIPQLPQSAWIHMFTLGALSLVVLGMISRVSLGHTGRVIQASNWVRASFMLLVFATIFRQWASWLPTHLWARDASLLLFTGAFVIFLWHYTPILTSARADGKTG